VADHQRRRDAGAEATRVTLLSIHILAGGLALVFGYVALFAAKGRTLIAKTGCSSSTRSSRCHSVAR
jgi:hypothetical protein